MNSEVHHALRGPHNEMYCGGAIRGNARRYFVYWLYDARVEYHILHIEYTLSYVDDLDTYLIRAGT